MEVISIYCVFLPMFGKLRLYERHQTPTPYQVLSMQIRLVNHLRSVGHLHSLNDFRQ